MMAYLSEDEVRQHADELCRMLQQAGYQAEIVPHSFRDYHCKIWLQKGAHVYGNLVLYHRTTKNTFTLGTHELKDKTIVPELMALHEQRSVQTQPVPPARSKPNNDFSTAEYYRAIFQPYASEPFDFSLYARALMDVGATAKIDISAFWEARFDFAQLTTLHQELYAYLQTHKG